MKLKSDKGRGSRGEARAHIKVIFTLDSGYLGTYGVKDFHLGSIRNMKIGHTSLLILV